MKTINKPKNSHLTAGNNALRELEYKTALWHFNQAKIQVPRLAHIIDKNIKLTETLLAKASPQKKENLVDIIVPIYNALSDVKLCLESLQKHTDGFAVNIIIVNDGSDQETTQYLRKVYSENRNFTLIEHVQNHGYTKAINSGLAKSTADYVVTQNSDTIVTSEWLKRLINCIESAPNIGIAGPLSNAASWQNVPLLKDDDGSFSVNQLPNGINIDEMAEIVKKSSNHLYPRTPFLNGFCFMIKREVIDKIGNLDELNFPVGYGEENDYCIRAADAGYEMVIADDVYIYHAKSKSFGHSRRTELSREGSEKLKKKHSEAKVKQKIELIQNIKELDKIRLTISQALTKGASKSTYSCTCEPEVLTKDMHGTPIKLSPPPVYGSRDYQVEVTHTAPCLLIPLNQNKEYLGKNKNTTQNIGVHLHLFYEDQADEFIRYLQNIKCEFSLYITITNEKSADNITKAFFGALKNAKIEVISTPNQGRDIGPMLVGVGKKLLKHELFCHIHSKRSLHNINKSDWRRQLVTNLLGSPSLVNNVFQTFKENPHLGLLYPEYHFSLDGQISWGTNFDISTKLAKKLNLNISKDKLKLFPAGSMFWARTNALKKMLAHDFTWNDFPAEAGQVDGTLAHAVERLIGEIVYAAGYQQIQIKTDKPYNLINYHPHKWPFKYHKPIAELNSEVATYTQKKKARNTHAQYAVYTALTSGYDQPVVHERLSSKIDYLLFSDTSISDRGFWEVRSINHHNTNAVRKARYIKTNPHLHLNDYEIVIWIDANVIIMGDIEKYINYAKENPSIPIFGIHHPHRQCIYEEAKAVIQSKKDTEERVTKQIEKYRKLGYPPKNGLIETNLLVINMKNAKTREIFSRWSDEIENESHRDQLSLNFCLWQAKAEWLPIFKEKITLRDSHEFAYMGHGKNSGFPAELKIDSEHIQKPI